MGVQGVFEGLEGAFRLFFWRLGGGCFFLRRVCCDFGLGRFLRSWADVMVSFFIMFSLFG